MKNVNIGEPKEKTFERRRLVSFGERYMSLETLE
jgi:hypothetical protein